MKNPEKQETAVSTESATPKKSPANVFDGVLTSISPTKLVMKGRGGQKFSMKLHEEVKSTCDGIACERKALKPGQKIRVVTQKTDLAIATSIASLDKNSRFTPVV